MRDFEILQLTINHIGAFEELNLQFKKGIKQKVNNGKAEIYILTGENGTGKSTILEVITAFADPSKLTAKVHKNHSDKANFHLRFGNFDFYKEEEIYNIEEVISKFEKGKWSNPFKIPGAIPGTHRTSVEQYLHKWNNYQFEKFDFAIFAYSGYRRINQSDVNFINEISENPLINSLDLNNSINPKIILQWIANTKTKEALAFTRGDIKTADKYNRAIQQIESVVSQITDLKIEFYLEDNPLKVQVKVDDVNLDFALLPDGLKSIISWIADLMMRMDRLNWATDVDLFERNFVLLLDEVEVHLHPAWQRKVLPIIQRLFPNAQIIVSTHSPFVTNSIDGAWIFKFKKQGSYSVLDGEPILSEDAKSYRTILEEVFGIERQFGEDVEKDLDRFYGMKREILAGKRNLMDNDFVHLTNLLVKQSVELENIIGMELKQIKRTNSQKVSEV